MVELPTYTRMVVGSSPTAPTMLYQTLKENLFAEVAYPPALTNLIGDLRPWQEFYSLSQDIKNKFTFPNHQVGKDPGYVLRSRAAGREDKEYFHFYPGCRQWANEYGHGYLITQTPALQHFFDYGFEVQRASREFASMLGEQIGERLPECRRLIQEDRCNYLLRFLHYIPEREDEVSLADQHYDRSLYTLHLYESKPGLQFLNWDMKWTEAPIEAGKTVIFSGYRLEKLTEGDIQKVWHRVVPTPGDRERHSAVLFVWSPDVPDYERGSRSQTETPGYMKN